LVLPDGIDLVYIVRLHQENALIRCCCQASSHARVDGRGDADLLGSILLDFQHYLLQVLNVTRLGRDAVGIRSIVCEAENDVAADFRAHSRDLKALSLISHVISFGRVCRARLGAVSETRC